MKRNCSGHYLYFLFAFVICAPMARAQSKEYPSLLWEISGNGLTKPSYLYGTMHVSKKVAFHLSEAFFDDLKSTDVVALETNPETWLSELMTEGMSMMNNNYLRSLLGNYNRSSFYEDAFGFTVPDNKSIQAQIAVEPENVNNLLYRFNGYSGNFEEYTYLDLFIFQSARKSDKKVIPLENFKTSLEMLMKASMPDDDKDQSSYLKKKTVSRNIGDQIEDAYRNGDLDALDSLNKASYTTRNFEKYMIVDRNVIMANHMDSVMRKQSLFTAIGAAHLPGSAGVISLLRKMGYTVKPVTSAVSKKSIRTMDSFEETHTSLNFSTQYASDSSFHVDAPGHLFQMLGIDNMDTYLYTDMVNGSYYMVKRIRNYAGLKGHDAAYETRRIDSILYESIPGKILHRETVKANNGDPGFDIMNRTRRGDLQHYRIYVSDKYISIFKVSGDADYVKRSEVDKFFRSITFKTEASKSNWVTYSPSFGGYELSLPSGYDFTKPGADDYQKERITASDGKNYYMFTRSVLSDDEYIEEDTFELSQLGNNVYKALGYQQPEKKFGTYLSFPEMELTAKEIYGDHYLHLRILTKDQQYYMLACITDNEKQPGEFFNSLKFKDFRHDKMATYTDTTLYFSAKTDYTEAKQSLFESLASAPYLYYGKNKKKAPYEYWTKNKKIESPESAELVYLTVTKCNDYRNEKSPDAFWKRQVDYYKDDASLIIRSRKSYEKDGLPALDLTLCDTNSIKAIIERVLVHNGLLYTLTATIDTVAGPSPWITTFFDTFKPADTLIGKPVFQDKVAEFLQDAASKDSTTRDKVSTLYSKIRFEYKHAAPLMGFIGGADFNNVPLNIKTFLLSQLGYLKDPAIAGFLKKEYPKYADSSSIQLSILKALASQETKEGNAVFLQSLLAESPLSDSQSDVMHIFSPFYDSLKLAPALYPQVLQVTRYDEYKPGVYELMSTLLDSALIKPAAYDASRKEILRDANDELKREFKSEENGSGNSYSKSGNFDYSSLGNNSSSAEQQALMDAMAAAEAAAAAESSGYSADLLINYCNLLAPSYETDPAVKALFAKAFKTRNTDFEIALVSILLKNNLPVPDTTIDNLAKDMKTRVSLYSALKDIHKLDKIKPGYRSQESLVQATIFSDRDTPADSTHLILTRFVQNKDESGLVYFYRSADKDGNKYLHYFAFQPKDSTAFEPHGYSGTKSVYETDNVSEMMDKISYELSLLGRKRVRTEYLNEDYNYSYGD